MHAIDLCDRRYNFWLNSDTCHKVMIIFKVENASKWIRFVWLKFFQSDKHCVFIAVDFHFGYGITYIRPFNLPNQLKRQMSELPDSCESYKMNVWHSFGIRIKGLAKCTQEWNKKKRKRKSKGKTNWNRMKPNQSNKQTKWLNYFD